MSTNSDQSQRLFMGLVIFIIIAIFMSTLVWYVSESEPEVNKVAMNVAADSFTTSVVNAHWQWRAEGNPNRIILIEYNRAQQEVDRRPVTMSHLGWPKVEPSREGCEQLWKSILGLPLKIQGFKVKANYYNGLDVSGKILDSFCRFSIAVGPYFDYKVYTGVVTKSDA
ncbi:hypothetical protein [Alteromonas sp. a30]|uniref:hypothetical protein n=1 Tax=Alteromonas sp. a30 TaxID=2730917 RepID=UPI00227F2CE6|nr:hypothetical protein [Alteromonas sp. a30]MCY7295271.1 hypothetical protein [Alteromonas sp. a30]